MCRQTCTTWQTCSAGLIWIPKDDNWALFRCRLSMLLCVSMMVAVVRCRLREKIWRLVLCWWIRWCQIRKFIFSDVFYRTLNLRINSKNRLFMVFPCWAIISVQDLYERNLALWITQSGKIFICWGKNTGLRRKNLQDVSMFHFRPFQNGKLEFPKVKDTIYPNPRLHDFNLVTEY